MHLLRTKNFIGSFGRRMISAALRWWIARGKVNFNAKVLFYELGEKDVHTFFGYHDISPFSSNDQLLLACQSKMLNDKLGYDKALQLGIYDLSARKCKFECFASTKSWCWQQGARLQWFPATSNDTVLFNTSESNKHVSRVFNIGTQKIIGTIPFPIYSINKTGELGISLDFVRLQRLRPGYGYSDLAEKNKGEYAPNDNGLYLVNMKSGLGDLVFSLAAAASVDPVDTMIDAEHYFNHVLWSPCGMKFFFMHLWRSESGKRFNRAFVYDVVTSKASLINGGVAVSHHCWVNETKLIVFSNGNYRVIDIYGSDISIIGEGMLLEDGHPSMCPTSKQWFVTDTYPDRLREQNLVIFDLERSNVIRVGSFYSPIKYKGEVRCDLHPRWDRSGNRICFDSAHSGERKLCVVDLDGLLTRSLD